MPQPELHNHFTMIAATDISFLVHIALSPQGFWDTSRRHFNEFNEGLGMVFSASQPHALNCSLPLSLSSQRRIDIDKPVLGGRLGTV